MQWLSIRFRCKRTRVQFPAPARVFMFDFLFCCCFHFFVQKHIICHNILQNPFAMLIYLLYLTYCKICNRLHGYKDSIFRWPSIFNLPVILLIMIQSSFPSTILHWPYYQWYLIMTLSSIISIIAPSLPVMLSIMMRSSYRRPNFSNIGTSLSSYQSGGIRETEISRCSGVSPSQSGGGPPYWRIPGHFIY